MRKYDLKYTVGEEDEGMTVRGVLRRRRGVSQRLIRKISNAHGVAFFGGVYVNDEVALFKDRVACGDVVGIVFPDENSGFVPQDIEIEVLYEDEDLLAVNKRPGIVVHPTKGHVDGTIANGLMNRMMERGERYKIRFANRLDMDTSGVLLIGKHSHVQSEFARQSERGLITKRYIAVLDGVPGRDEDTIDRPIALESEGSPRRTVRADGASSKTYYKISERYVYLPDFAGMDKNQKKAALVFIELGTGRTHQIRVHMKYIGAPVMGDALYGSPSVLISRQALHASELGFVHPVTGEKIVINAPLPPDMKDCISALKVQNIKLTTSY